MIFIEYPITGSLRMLLIVMESIFTFFSFEFGILLLIKYRKQSRNLKNTQDLGFSSLFFGFSIMRLFFIVANYYTVDNILTPFMIWDEGSYRTLFLNFGYLSIMIGTLIFSYYMEKYKKILFRKLFFSISYFVLLLVSLVIFVFNLEFINFLSILSWILFIFLIIIYGKDFGKKSKIQGILSKGLLKLTLSLILILIGYIVSMDLIVEFIGLIAQFLGVIIQLIAICLIFIFFRKIPPFYEFDWKDKIESLYILNKNGICLYNRSFINNIEPLEEQFISGAFASLNIMLDELIQSTPNTVSIIKKKGKNVNIFSGKYITGVLISQEELKYFTHILKKLVLRVEEIYWNILNNWNGDLTIFNPVKNIIDELFLI